MERIYLNLVALLDEQKLTRYELAKRTGVKYQTIDSYYKNRVVRYDSDLLLKICNVLDCSIDQLIKLE